MSQKLRFWPKMAIFSHVRPNLGKMRIFLKKRALLFFYPYCPPTSCQVSEKSLERFPRSIALRTDVRTDGRTRVILQNRSLRWFNIMIQLLGIHTINLFVLTSNCVDFSAKRMGIGAAGEGKATMQHQKFHQIHASYFKILFQNIDQISNIYYQNPTFSRIITLYIMQIICKVQRSIYLFVID